MSMSFETLPPERGDPGQTSPEVSIIGNSVPHGLADTHLFELDLRIRLLSGPGRSFNSKHRSKPSWRRPAATKNVRHAGIAPRGADGKPRRTTRGVSSRAC